MIIGEAKEKKLYISMVAVAILLFLFGYGLLKETVPYSLACAIAPFPAYCLMDKIYVLRKMKKYKARGERLYVLAGINLFIMLAATSYCVYLFSDGNAAYTMAGACAYGLADMALFFLGK